MKKVLHLTLIAAAVLSLAACQKEIESSIVNDGKEVQLNFTSEKPALINPETKTAWTGETITWSKGDAIRVAYTVNGTWQAAEAAASETTKAKLYASSQLSADAEVAAFAVSANFKDTQNSELTDPAYKFYAIYPSGLISGTDFSNPPYIPFSIANEQTPKAASFDGALDIMYATSDNYTGIPDDRNVDLTWHRIVSHADISMRNLLVEAGETLESIIVTAQEGADLVGSHTLNITDGTVALASGATAGNSVTVKADNLTLTDGAVEFWFTTLPFTASELTFTVKTDKYTYVRSFTGLELQFKGNARNTLSVNMKKAQKFQDYEESFSSSLGEFTTSGTSSVWSFGTANSGADKFAKATSYIDKKNTDAEAWLISPYLTILSDDSQLSFRHCINKFFGTVSDEATVWVREKDDEWKKLSGITYPTLSGNWSSFEETGSALGTYKGKTIQIGFKYIGTSTTAGTWEINTFKVTNAEVVYYPSFEFTSAMTKEVSFSASTVQFTYSASHLTSEPTVAVKAGSDDIIDGTPTIANGVITVNVKANDDTENAKQATLVVTCEGVTGIPDLVINQAKKENLVEKSVTLDFTAQNYSNQQEVSNLNVDPITATLDKGTNSNAPKYYTSGTSVRCYGGNTLTLSSEKKIVKVVFTFDSGEGNNTITSDKGSYSDGTWTGNATSVTFTIGGTSGHRRISKIAVTYLDEAGDAPVETEYDITITQPTGGTITATVNGASVIKAKAGDEVTLTVGSFDSGYTFGSWNVTGVTVGTTNPVTFIMPANAVTVTANLNDDNGGGNTGEKTLQTIFLETFGSTTSNNAVASYTGYTATSSMFRTTGDVTTHYSGSGSVGKNSLSAANLSSGYDGASGLSGCYHVGTANTEATILTISDINIKDCEDISVSFGALGAATTHKINVYYKIDSGTETALISEGSITNAKWTLLSAKISGTGNSLTLIFKHKPTKAWTIRMDDVKVVGKK